jgi:RNA polymerase sigma factor (sigma-70 family)
VPVADAVTEARFSAVFNEHRRGLLRFLRRRVGNEEDAAEIAQEAYLRLLRYADQQDPQALKALLYRIAINLVGMRQREAGSRHQSEHLPIEDLPLMSDEASQEQKLVDQQNLQLLMSAIRELPERCRQVFVLSRFHEMSYPQIAAHCGVSVKMVEKHISRALAACREKLGER